MTGQELCSYPVIFMSRLYKSSLEPPNLILRLRGLKDYGWESREIRPPPAIQIETADELQRLEGQVQLLKGFIQNRGLFAEIVRFKGHYQTVRRWWSLVGSSQTETKSRRFAAKQHCCPLAARKMRPSFP